jgi:8-oxo-dGTP pyrophosphatase MutT (NUDIX family)
MQSTLPGLPAMLRMAPPFRQKLIARNLPVAQPRMAAVLIPITRRNQQLHVILTKRCTYPGVHSAQVSFPGGRKEQKDKHLQATALRETQEELRLKDSQIELLGALTPLYIQPSNYWVHPYAGILHNPPIEWNPQTDEVDQVLEPSLNELLDPAIRIKKQTQTSEGTQEVPGFQLDEHFIWGATAMMLEEFLCLLDPHSQHYPENPKRAK